MSNTAENLSHSPSLEERKNVADDCEVVALKDFRNRESLSENFYDEMDIWFRRAIASNGFGGI